jgi:hypothetical protein
MPTQAEISLSPISAKGDILSTDGSSRTRVAVGTNGQILTARSSATSGIQFETAGSGASSTVQLIYSTTVTAAVTSIAISFSNDTSVAAYYVEGDWRCTRTSDSESGIYLSGNTASLNMYALNSYYDTGGWTGSRQAAAGPGSLGIVFPSYSNSSYYETPNFTPFYGYISNGTNVAPGGTGLIMPNSLFHWGSIYDAATGTLYGRTRILVTSSNNQSSTVTGLSIIDGNPSFSSIAIGSTFRVYSIKKV